MAEKARPSPEEMAGMSAEPRVEPPLAGFTVVELSTGIAGAYCTKLLADGGAA